MKTQATQTLIAAWLMMGLTQTSLADNLFQAQAGGKNRLAAESMHTAILQSAFKPDTPILALQNGLRMNPAAVR